MRTNPFYDSWLFLIGQTPDHDALGGAKYLLVALYAAAPGLADKGPVGAALMRWHAQVDEGRGWLDGRADALLAMLGRR